MRSEHKDGVLDIDIEDLKYISSAGLRSLLRLQPQEAEKINIINASLEVAEIFSMTGFDQIMSVKRGYEKISVEGLPVIGRGASGTVYRIDKEKIVKVYQPDASLEDIKRERDLAQKAFFKGFLTAITFNVVRCGDCYGVVFELLDAKSLSETIVENPDVSENMWKRTNASIPQRSKRENFPESKIFTIITLTAAGISIHRRNLKNYGHLSIPFWSEIHCFMAITMPRISC